MVQQYCYHDKFVKKFTYFLLQSITSICTLRLINEQWQSVQHALLHIQDVWCWNLSLETPYPNLVFCGFSLSFHANAGIRILKPVDLFRLHYWVVKERKTSCLCFGLRYYFKLHKNFFLPHPSTLPFAITQILSVSIVCDISSVACSMHTQYEKLCICKHGSLHVSSLSRSCDKF
jgi:hypothetical protein